MNTSIIPFDYADHQVRVLDIDDEPWFVLADVCKALDIGNPTMVAGRLEGDALSTAEVIDSMGRNQAASIISEAGLYEVIFLSRKPEAKAFKRWVTHEVLPSIRRRGIYATAATVDQMLADPDTAIRLLSEIKAERAERAKLEAQAEADRPKVLFAEAVATSQTDILIGDLAKIIRGNGIDVGANRLFRDLRKKQYLISRKGTDWNQPTQKAMDLGLFRVKETVISHGDGHTSISFTTKVTGKGQQYFVERYLSGRLELEDAA